MLIPSYPIPNIVAKKDEYKKACSTFYGQAAKYKDMLYLLGKQADDWFDPFEDIEEAADSLKTNASSAVSYMKDALMDNSCKNKEEPVSPKPHLLPSPNVYSSVDDYMKDCKNSLAYRSIVKACAEAGILSMEYDHIISEMLKTMYYKSHPQQDLSIMAAVSSNHYKMIKQIQKAGNNAKQVQVGIVGSSTAKPLFKEDVTVKTVTKPSLWSRVKKTMHSIFYKKVPDGDYRKETH